MDKVVKIMVKLSLFLTLCHGYIIKQYPTQRQKAMTPYILDTGESYRDVLTLESSKLVGEIAKRFQLTADHKARTNIYKSHMSTKSYIGINKNILGIPPPFNLTSQILIGQLA